MAAAFFITYGIVGTADIVAGFAAEEGEDTDDSSSV